jgi:hypothetical protein
MHEQRARRAFYRMHEQRARRAFFRMHEQRALSAVIAPATRRIRNILLALTLSPVRLLAAWVCDAGSSDGRDARSSECTTSGRYQP